MPSMKMLSTWLLLSTLTLVNLQRVSLPRGMQHPSCVKPDLLVISEYFKKTTIVRLEDTTEVKYCDFMDDDDALNKLHTSLDLDTVIDLYATFGYVNSYKHIDEEGPVIYDGELSINDDEHLPLYKVANIKKEHLECEKQMPGFGDEVIAQMKLMNLRNTDARGYLLANSLGGESNTLNVIPMAVNVYFHQNDFVKHTDILGFPHAFWRSNEYWIRRFLLRFYPSGRVFWKIALQYDENVFLNPKMFRSYRPISFSLHYVAYTNEFDDNSVYYDSPLLTFHNDNHYSCSSLLPCNKNGVLADEADDLLMKKEHDCEMAVEEPIGDVGTHILHEKDWNKKHEVAFPYYVKGKAYFYVQNEDRKWFIHELLPGGKVGDQTGTGELDFIYKYSFTYFMNGTHYMYAHNHEDNSWFIRVLLPSGTLGEANTEIGYWDKVHWSCHGLTLNGKHYFLIQSSDKKLKIRELLPGGQMGKKDVWTDTVQEADAKIVHLAFPLSNRLVFMRHVHSTKRWYLYSTEDNIEDFKVTQEGGNWDYGYNILFTYILDDRRFIYGLATETPYHSFIRKILPSGKIGEKTFSHDEVAYTVAFPFTINGAQYLYKQRHNDSDGEIHQFH